jgi:hypothetical protein
MWHYIQTMYKECCSKIQPSVMLLVLYISMNHFRYGRFVYRHGAIVWGAQLKWTKCKSSSICHGVGPLVDPFRSHVARSLLQSVNALIIRFYFQLLFKNPSLRFGSYSRVDNVRTQPFFWVIDWHALQERRVRPPEKPEIVEVSSTDPVFISCHKQLLLTSQGNLGNKGIITSTTLMKKCKFRYVLCWGGGIEACAHRHVHACLLVSIYRVRIQIALKSKRFCISVN